MSAVMERVELWSGLAKDGGVLRAVFDRIGQCQTSHRIEGMASVSTLALTLARGWDRSTTVTPSWPVPGQVVRIAYPSGSFDEYRIFEVTDAAHDGTVRVAGRGALYELAQKDRLVSVTLNGAESYTVTKRDTPSNLLTYFLGFAASGWSTGTVTPTTVVEVTVNQATTLAAVTAVAAAVAEATGTVYELSARRNGSSGYYLDLTVLGASATVPDIRTGKNLATLTRVQNGHLQATRLIPFGADGRSLGDNWWKVATVSVNTYIEVDDFNGGLSPLVQDGALDNLYIVDDANTTHEITAATVTSATRAKFAMASTTNISVGDAVRIALDASGNPVRYVDHLTGTATYGVVVGTLSVPTIPGVMNWLRNGDFSDWPGTNPTDWSVTASSNTKDTGAGNWETGGQSAKTPAATANLYQSRSVYCLAGSTVTYYCRLKIESFGTATNDYIQTTNPQSGGTDDTLLDGTVAGLDVLGRFLTFTKTYEITSSGVKTIRMDLFRGSLGGTKFWDSAMATVAPPGVTPNTVFVRHSGGATLWLKSLRYLRDHYAPPLTYRGTIADLNRVDAERWPDDELVLGGTVRVTDADLNLTTSVRLVEMVRDELAPADTQVVWSTRRPDLTTYLAGVL